MNSQYVCNSIDLNCDVGEIDSDLDHAILPWLSSCNVSCGIHAGNPVLIAATLREAIRLGVAIGAHPSYPDREHFGRMSMSLPYSEIAEHLRYQIAAIQGMVNSLGGQLHHIKMHGALYNDIVRDVHLAEMTIEVIRQVAPTLAFYGQADTHLAEVCEKHRIPFVHEVFGDRRYEDKTTLRSRTHDNAIIDNPDSFQQQLSTLLKGYVVDVHQRKHKLCVQTLCLHGDTPRALEFAQLANRYLKGNHVSIAVP